MNHPDELGRFLGRAYRRAATLLGVEQCFRALSTFCAGAVLVLLLGAQIFDWYWPALLAAATLTVGWLRVRKHIPSRYRLAQRIDRRMHLRDALSTALYFREHPDKATSDELRLLQEAQAERLAGSLAVHDAVPFAFPRAGYVAVALLSVVLTLVGVRYGVLRTLDTRAPLATLVLDLLPMLANRQHKGDTAKDRAEQTDAAGREQLDEIQKMARNQVMGFSSDPSKSGTSPNASLVDMTQSKPGQPGTSGESQTLDMPGSSGQPSKEGLSAQPGSSNSPAPSQNNRTGAERAKSGEPPQGSSNNLLDKMRDALNNLMAKMGRSDAPNSPKQEAKAQSEAGARNDSDEPSDKGTLAQGQTAIQGPDSRQGDPNGQNSKSSNTSREKSRQNASVRSPKDSNSGIGSADGDKSVRMAEQQQAMGKISEILGRRSVDLTGEVTVEVKNGNQGLKTQYSTQSVRRSAQGGEVRRDEIPLEYQPYVQKYFEQIRKLPPAGKSGESRGTTPAAGSQ